MISESKRLQVFTCPGCLEEVRYLLTRRELEEALRTSRLRLYHPVCNHNWEQLLGPRERTDLASFIQLEFPDQPNR
jgi:hypothetical protein